MHETDCASILLIGFNRPDFMRDQIAALRSVCPPRIYIAVDGPRPNREDDIIACAAVRECVNDIDWPCMIRTLFQSTNQGCKYGVSKAISWFFENESEGIILEDDCRPTPDFLRFASTLLAYYRNTENIGTICGFNPYNLQSDKTASYHFSTHFGVWGWASWRRVWEKYDVTLQHYANDLHHILDNNNLCRSIKKDLKNQIWDVQNGYVETWSTWDVQLGLMLRANNLLSIHPRERLIMNTGICNGEATHTGGYDLHAESFSRAGHLSSTIIHPQVITPDYETDRRNAYLSSGFMSRAFTYIGCKIPSFRPLITTLCAYLERHIPILFYW